MIRRKPFLKRAFIHTLLLTHLVKFVVGVYIRVDKPQRVDRTTGRRATEQLVVHANMLLSDCQTLTGATFFLWQDLTSSFLQNHAAVEQETYNVSNLYISVSIQDQENIYNKTDLSIRFDADISFSSSAVNGTTQSLTNIVSDAFNTLADQMNYIRILQQSNDPSFSKVQSVFVVSPALSSSSFTPSVHTGVSKRNIILISSCVGGGGSIVVFVVAVFIHRMIRKRKSDKIQLANSFSTDVDKSNKSDDSDEGDMLVIEASMNQDISTLGADTWDRKSFEKRKNFPKEDDSKISADHCSVDYEFFNELCDEQHQQMSSQYSVLTDESSLTNICNDHHVEMIAIVAPAGLLGMVVDTAFHGVPTIYSIKDSSPLFGQVLVGDKLISINNIDTTDMTALQVSKLIMQLRAQKRVLVVLRSVGYNNSVGGSRCSA